jgi:hypothetical protein
VVVEDNHGPLVCRQSLETTLELIPGGNSLLHVGDLRTRGVGDGDLDAQAVPVRLGNPVTRADEDPLEPGVESIRITKPSQILPGANEDLLHDVLG